MQRSAVRTWPLLLAAGFVVLLAIAGWVLKPAEARPPSSPTELQFCGFDLPASSGAAIVTGSLTPSITYPTVAYAITISVDTDSVVNFTSSDGTTTYDDDLNSGTALTAGAVYTFLVSAARTSTNSAATMQYNIECETTCRIRRLQIDEVRGDAR